MKKHGETKIIKAIPMTLEEAYSTMGKPTLKGQDVTGEGYLVGYLTTDDKTFDGNLTDNGYCLSWFSKARFDNVYKSIKG